ncbi:uncharacterized protein CTRU02_202537 [Colletotrichum truncatum]|uniref:Uncharacterized protein n=1 Tax=Colletotrichum truncatum TaxID=5467 RepID=A0ACC3ZKM6_COLTU|nr:uncharacterized protein CTRU02_01705 [Colletotrichum truncatum]KAF6800026.1 hypothetical protein CTRU02_01705 [Colletotrichum truncatum]
MYIPILPSAICYRIRLSRQRAPLPAHSHLNHPSFASPIKFGTLHSARPLMGC